MTLRWIDRLGVLLRADAHGALEALEDSGRVLRQHLRDAELEVLQKRARVEALREEEARLEREAERLVGEIRGLDEDVALALEGGGDDLARFALRRLLPKQREAGAARARAGEVRTAREKLAARLATQEEALVTLRARVRAHAAGAPAGAGVCGEGGEAAVADEEVELELLRRRGGRTG